jgi:hypothetical protein
MDNGDYKSNFRLSRVEIIPQNNDRTGGSQEDLATDTVFFVVAVTELGATPQTANAESLVEGNLDLRLSDNAIIAWGCIAPSRGYSKVIIDPGHIITEDIYVNAWSTASDGSLRPNQWNLGYMLHIENVKESGTEGLISRTRQSAIED